MMRFLIFSVPACKIGLSLARLTGICFKRAGRKCGK